MSASLRKRSQAEQRAAVVAEAWSWLEAATPYHAHGRIKGVGVDCGNLLCCVYEAAGIIAPLDPGFYDTGWHLHRNEEMFLAFVRQAGGRQVDRPRAGDFGVWRFGRTYSHGGILVTDELVVHAYLDAGVIATRLGEEPLASRPARFFTVWEG